MDTSTFLNIAIAWAVFLTPPVLIRSAILRRPMRKWTAIATSAGLAFLNLSLLCLDGACKPQPWLAAVAAVSYYILRWVTPAQPKA